MGHNLITNISPITGLVNLESLHLEDNSISDISAMTNMTKLVDVLLGGNSIAEITSLSGKATIQYLSLNGTKSPISAHWRRWSMCRRLI